MTSCGLLGKTQVTGKFTMERLEGGGGVAVLVLQRHGFKEEVEGVGDIGHCGDAGLEHGMLVGDFVDVDLVAAAGANVVSETDVAALVVGHILEGIEGLAFDDGGDAVDGKG